MIASSMPVGWLWTTSPPAWPRTSTWCRTAASNDGCDDEHDPRDDRVQSPAADRSSGSAADRHEQLRIRPPRREPRPAAGTIRTARDSFGGAQAGGDARSAYSWRRAVRAAGERVRDVRARAIQSACRPSSALVRLTRSGDSGKNAPASRGSPPCAAAATRQQCDSRSCAVRSTRGSSDVGRPERTHA